MVFWALEPVLTEQKLCSLAYRPYSIRDVWQPSRQGIQQTLVQISVPMAFPAEQREEGYRHGACLIDENC